MKNKYLLVFLLPALVLMSYSGGAPSGYTGSPGDGGQTCTACHSFSGTDPQPNISLTGFPTDGYTPGQTYNLHFAVTNVNNPKTGFQITVENSSNQKQGSFNNPDANTQDSQGGNYITHTSAGTSNHEWDIQWTAPATSQGNLNFYYAVNIANGNGASTGDYIQTGSVSINENTSSVNDAENDKINIYPNPASNILNIDSKLNIDNVYIYNVSGQKMDIELKNNKIDISKLAKGNYILKIISKEKKLSKQFIKK